jgi:hypothetical protein
MRQSPGRNAPYGYGRRKQHCFCRPSLWGNWLPAHHRPKAQPGILIFHRSTCRTCRGASAHSMRRTSELHIRMGARREPGTDPGHCACTDSPVYFQRRALRLSGTTLPIHFTRPATLNGCTAGAGDPHGVCSHLSARPNANTPHLCTHPRIPWYSARSWKRI